MRNIGTYGELLKAQQDALKSIDYHQEQIRLRMEQTQQKITPVFRLIDGVSSVLYPSKPSLLKTGVGAAVDIFVRNRLLKNAPFIVKASGGILGKTLVAGFLMSKLFKRKKKKKN